MQIELNLFRTRFCGVFCGQDVELLAPKSRGLHCQLKQILSEVMSHSRSVVEALSTIGLPSLANSNKLLYFEVKCKELRSPTDRHTFCRSLIKSSIWI